VQNGIVTDTNTSTGRSIVVAGGSFAGLGAAYTLRERLRPEDRITVVSPSDHFVFTPSLVWAAFGAPVLNSSFNLDAALASKGIAFRRASIEEVRVDEHVVRTEKEEIPYDRLIIATGGRPDAQSVPGLAGEFQAASWIVGEASAMDARNVLRRLFASPGPVIVGAAQGAGYISAAYELALALDAELRKRGLRDQVPMTFVTAEPYPGHLGFGQTAARQSLETIFAERSIPVIPDVTIERVEPDSVRLSSGHLLDASTVIIMPPFTGAVSIWKSARLTDESGLIPVTDQYRHVDHLDVYAAGVASYFRDPVEPLHQHHAPETGYLALRMGKAAGQSVAASLGSGAPASRPLPYVFDVRVIDGLTSGLLLTSRGTTRVKNTATRLPGRSAHFLKELIERYLLWRLRSGRMDLP
jgi:sulfide:quinone oxidoreductase